MSETRVKFLDRVLTDNLYENAVDKYQMRARRRNAVILVVLAIVVGLLIWKFVA